MRTAIAIYGIVGAVAWVEKGVLAELSQMLLHPSKEVSRALCFLWDVS